MSVFSVSDRDTGRYFSLYECLSISGFGNPTIEMVLLA